LIFGGLAIMVTGVTIDPLALRPRLSPGLPFWMFSYVSIVKHFPRFVHDAFVIS
jgi:hypothetical protein